MIRESRSHKANQLTRNNFSQAIDYNMFLDRLTLAQMRMSSMRCTGKWRERGSHGLGALRNAEHNCNRIEMCNLLDIKP